ncbi:MAG: sugar ABC transporter permease [Propionibacteriaceae bacterium]|nr:sugar ABC transporter permease [Propionibacteriaceae bacterium]
MSTTIVTKNPTHRAGRQRSRRGGSRYTLAAFIAPAYIFLAISLILPVLNNVWNSFFDVNNKTVLTGKAPFVGAANYSALTEDGELQKAIATTLIFVFANVVLQYVLGFALALWFNRRFPGAGWQRGLLILALMQPPIVTGVIFKWILDGHYGVLNAALRGLGMIHQDINWLSDPRWALICVILMNVWVGTPFTITLLVAGLKSLPSSVYEAAEVDGASVSQRFWYVTFPMMRPVSFTALILSAVYTFKVFDLVYVSTAGGPGDSTRLMTVMLYDLSFHFFRFGEGAAAANILIAMPLALAALYAYVTRREN